MTIIPFARHRRDRAAGSDDLSSATPISGPPSTPSEPGSAFSAIELLRWLATLQTRNGSD